MKLFNCWLLIVCRNTTKDREQHFWDARTSLTHRRKRTHRQERAAGRPDLRATPPLLNVVLKGLPVLTLDLSVILLTGDQIRPIWTDVMWWGVVEIKVPDISKLSSEKTLQTSTRGVSQWKWSHAGHHDNICLQPQHSGKLNQDDNELEVSLSVTRPRFKPTRKWSSLCWTL